MKCLAFLFTYFLDVLLTVRSFCGAYIQVLRTTARCVEVIRECLSLPWESGSSDDPILTAFLLVGCRWQISNNSAFSPLRRTVRPDGHWNQERVFCCFCGWITKRLFYDWFLRYGVLSSRPLRFIIAILLRLGSGRMPVSSLCTTIAPCQVDSQYLDPCLKNFFFKKRSSLMRE